MWSSFACRLQHDWCTYEGRRNMHDWSSTTNCNQRAWLIYLKDYIATRYCLQQDGRAPSYTYHCWADNDDSRNEHPIR